MMIINCNFTANNAYSGGAVSNAGNVTISDSNFTNNTANYGGALFNNGNALPIVETMTVHYCSFSGNSASGYGGAISSNSVLSVDNSNFKGNIVGSSGYGGAIHIYSGNYTDTNDTFINNTAYCGGVVFTSGVTTITGSKFTNNTASNVGGALCNINGGKLTINDSDFVGNVASGYNTNGGGAIYNDQSSYLMLLTCNFTANNAASGGAVNNAGNFTVINSNFTNNTATTVGGALFNNGYAPPFNDYITVHNCSFNGNSASSYGGAIGSNGVLIVDNSNFMNNIVGINGYGGAIYIGGGNYTDTNNTFINNTASCGGATFNTGNTTITDSKFINNTAYNVGGAIVNDSLANLNITRCEFTGNIAENSNGGAINNMGILNVAGSSFKLNHANMGGAIGNGGTGTIQFNSIVNNTATTGVSDVYSASGSLNSDNNWWGSNAGPSGKVYGTVVNKWLVLNINTYPTKIHTGQNSTVTANILYDNGILNDPNHPELYYHDPTTVHVPDGIIVNFSTSNGVVTSPLLLVNGSAQSNLNGLITDIAYVTATVDNQTVQSQVTTLPTPSANPTGGLYNKNQKVTLNMNIPGTIYYTLDGSDPTTSSSIYVTPISINISTVLKYLAVNLLGDQSPIYTDTYTIDTVPPTANADPTAGLYNCTKVITLSMSEPGTIYYTLDGSEPTTSSFVYINPITINSNTQLNFFAIDSAGNPSLYYMYTYKIDTIPPTAYASQSGGIYNTTQTVTLNMDKDGTIYYTLDGTAPTTSSSIYLNPITINTNTVLKYLAVDMAGNKSPVYTDNYIIDTVSPTANSNPAGGLYNKTKVVTLTMSKPGTIYYTQDGSDPTTSSSIYLNPISINISTVLKYLAVDLAGNKSPVYTDNYIIDTVPPTADANPIGGYYNITEKVALNMSKPGNIYYTTDGTTPTVYNTPYTNPITIDSNTILKYLAVDLAGNKSPLYTEEYTIDRIPPTVNMVDPLNNTMINVVNKKITVTFSEPIKPGSNYGSISVTGPSGNIIMIPNISGNILTLTPNSNYLDGNYTLNIPVNAVTDLSGNGLDVILSSCFGIDTVLPTASANPIGGLYKADQNVTLSMSKNGTIYYTTNGTTPTINSTPYKSKINITSTTTLKYFAVDLTGNQSPVYTQIYTIDKTSPTITSTDPTKNAVNVPTNKVIKITFSEPIKAGTMLIDLKDSKGKLTPITTSINGNILTINHATLFNNGTYSISLHTGCITDLAGNALALSGITFNVDGIPPKIKKTTPANNAVNVPINQIVKINFNEAIKFGKTSIIELKNNSGISIPFTSTITGNTLIIKPKSAFAHKTNYTITLHTGCITDLAGNGITIFSTKFTTA
jgi:predicted outer membrane repeat protein